MNTGGDLVFAVDVSADRGRAHIAVAGFDARSGLPMVEIAASRVGTDWVAGWFEERAGQYTPMRVVIQARGAPASSLAEGLAAIDGVEVVALGGPDLGNATAQKFELVQAS
jgi:hypothetical protein